MKTGLTVLLLFLGAFLALALLISGVHVLVLWGISFDEASSGRVGADLVVSILREMRATLLVAAVLATLGVLFRCLRLDGRPTGALLLLWLCAAGAIYGGLLVSDVLRRQLSPVAEPVRAPATGTLLRSPQTAIYIGQRENNELHGVLLWRSPAASDAEDNAVTGAQAGFSVHPLAHYRRESELIELQSNGFRVALRDVQNGHWQLFEPPAVLERLNEDVARTADRLSFIVRSDRMAGALTVVALALIVTMSWVIVRLTRWPLLNVVMAIGWIRLLFSVLPFALDSELGQPLQRLLPSAAALSHYLHPLILAAVALVLVIVNVVMPSFSHWKREVSDG
ncbi:MAG: hypothetical protein EA384_09850 [Spirochaetaceae bacterium]|nr:MAG: hypothetical protein EA384_09850 [Spirochaetaceae bacterium]